MKKIIIKTAKILAIGIGIVLLILIVLIVTIQIPYVQNKVKDVAISFVQEKIGTPVSLNRIEISFPKTIVLKELYLESQQQDTLLSADYVGVDISLFKLLSNTVEVNKVDLEGFHATIKRDTLQRFNFDYIVEAFASEDEKEETSSSMKIGVGQINLKNCNVLYEDDYEGDYANIHLGEFSTRFKAFDLEAMNFSVPTMLVNTLRLNYRKEQGFTKQVAVAEEPISAPAQESQLPTLNLGDIKFKDILVDFKDANNLIEAHVQFNEFLASFDLLDLVGQQIDLKEISLNKTNVAIRFLADNKHEAGKEEKREESTPVNADTETTAIPIPWRVGIKELLLTSIDLTYNDDKEKRVVTGLDPNHIGITDFNLGLKDFQFSASNIAGNLKRFSFSEQSGFQLQKFSTYFLYGEQSSFVKDFVFETPNTKVKTDVVLNYNDVTKLKENLGAISLDVVLNDSYLGLQDLYLLQPSILKEANLVELKEERFHLNAKMKGTVSNLLLDKVFVSGLGSTFVNVEGKIKGLPEIDKAVLDVKFKDFQTTARDIKRIAPKGTLPENITIPTLLKLNGKVSGTMDAIATQFKLNTSSGTVDVQANYDQRIKGREKYEVSAKMTEIALGRIIQNDSIGLLSMEFSAKGIGTDPAKMESSAALNISEFEFNHYNYKDIEVHGAIHEGVYSLATSNLDPNLNFDVQANGVYTDSVVSLDLVAAIKQIELQSLGLEYGVDKFSGLLDVKMANVMPDKLDGTIVLKDLMLDLDRTILNLKPITIEAVSDEHSRSLALNSELIDFTMQGNYQLTQLSELLTTSMSKYFALRVPQETEKEDSVPIVDQGQYFDYSIAVKDNPLLQKMIPSLEEISAMEIKGEYKQETDYLSLQGNIPKLKYGDIVISNIYLDVKPNQDKLVYSLGFDQLANASIALNRVNLKGEVYDNVLTYDLNVKDQQQKDSYRIAGKVETKDQVLIASLTSNGFVLDYQKWGVHEGNKIVLIKDGFYLKDFELTLGDSFMKINSEEELSNSPLLMEFNNFEIGTLTKLVQKDKVLATGLLGGSLYMKDLDKDFRFITSMNIQGLEVLEMPLGNLDVKVKNQSASEFATTVILQGGENKIQVQGVVDADKQSMDLELALEKIQMKTLEEFSMGNLSQSEGYLSGALKATGTFSTPQVLGEINFNDIGIHVNPINADFKNINEKITFTNEGIRFDKFSITDSDGNLLVIDGKVLTKDYQKIAFDMSLKAVDFKAINSTVKDNDMYYGTLVFDANIGIKGNLDKPIVTGGIEIGKKTSFTVVMPQEDPSIADREGIVEFVDEESIRLAEIKKYEADFNTSALKGLDVTMSIKVDKQAAFSMIMDKTSGDKVVIEGTGDLVGGIDASGKMTLTGRYEFTKGSYDLSFNFMKRKFIVEPGSSIIWMGEPTSALVDLTAIYETNASPYELLETQLSTMSPTQQNMYKQRIPFQAYLMMKGELLKPEISFDIKLKEGITSVSGDVISNTNTQLEQIRQNETELNKQVFSLLLLNRFIGENPFDTSAGSLSAGQMARQSVSRLLSDQLNNLAGNLIAGVELNFNLDSTEDFSSGTRENRTDLNLAVSKRLFSDRLKVTVGSSFEVEGSQRENEQVANIAGDIELEYALSKDGRYLLRVYRKNSYEVALQGQIVETGVGFVITMSYDKFKELFDKSKEKKELKNKLRDASKEK